MFNYSYTVLIGINYALKTNYIDGYQPRIGAERTGWGGPRITRTAKPTHTFLDSI